MNAHADIKSHQNLRGVSTVVYHAEDYETAKRWYTQVLGIEPYMDTPAYAEFRFGDHSQELGLLNTKFLGELGGGKSEATAPGGIITYWHVDDIEGTLERLTGLGAKPHHPPRDFGDGFIGATVIDPFGNILGLMYNPHYLDVLKGAA